MKKIAFNTEKIKKGLTGIRPPVSKIKEPVLKFKPALSKSKKGLARLKSLPRVLNRKEKIFFSVFFIAFLVSAVYLIVDTYCKNTILAPANGGILREGVVGQPRFINPVYAASNDPDRDLANLIYSGLFKYDTKGNVVPDIAKDYIVEEDGKTYHIFLREDVVFHDGEPLTADDVIFTIKSIQNPDFQSPIQAKWLDVKREKISDYQLDISLKNPYPGFLETLCLKILPAHIWEEIPAQNFPLSPYNFKPVGSGPFRLKNISQNKSGQITSILLEKFPKYYGQLPYLKQISFLFLNDQKELLRAADNNVIDSLAPLPTDGYKEIYNFNSYSFILPRYFALFFNSEENEFLEDEEVRMALNYATDKEELKEKVLSKKGTVVFSPFLPDVFHLTSSTPPVSYDSQKATELLEEAGFVEQEGKLVEVKEAETMNFQSDLSQGSQVQAVKYLQECLAVLNGIYPEAEVSGYFGPKTKEAVIRFQERYYDEILKPWGLIGGNGRVGPSTRKKLNELCVVSPAETIPFKITITTAQDPMLQKTAQILQDQWGKIGITVEIESLPISTIKQEVIKERKYGILLFGQVLGVIPDPFPFWHSSQRNYPGLNLADYKNKDVDTLLEQARVESDKEIIAKKFQQAQDCLIEDWPAVFLFNPGLTYLASTKLKGVEAHIIADPSYRFAGILNWHIKTRRIWK